MVVDRFDYSRIPPYIRESLDLYARDGRPLGHFLTAVLTNDLFEACGRADDNNVWVLPVITAYVFNHLPGGCWGSPEKVAAWREHRGLEGLGHDKDAPLPDAPRGDEGLKA